MKLIEMKLLKSFLFAGLLAGTFLPALASATPVRFDITGQYNRPGTVAFTGTIDIDPDLGKVLDVSIAIPGLATFDSLRITSTSQPQLWHIQLANVSRDVFNFYFSTPLASGRPGSLLGFDGGSITRGTIAGPGITGTITGITGSITRAAVVAVPEPAALGLFGLGVLLLGLGAGLRRRYH